MKSYENYALFLGENLNHQVFQNFVLPVTRQFGKIRLREKDQYEWMDRIVRNTTHSFKIDLVNIYDINNGVIAYSTDPSLLGKKIRESLGYKKAVQGENSSRLITGGTSLWGLGIEKMGGEKKLRTYIPFTGIDPFIGDTRHVLGVFEIIQDLTEEYKSLIQFQYLVFGLSILIMGMIFIALLFIVRKAERIIDERAKEQRELEAQLNHAERLAALGEMVAGVSHEIRNPLGIIRSTAELLGSMPDSHESKVQLTGLIIDFLDEILNKNILFLQPELEKKGISLHDNLNRRSLKLRADPQLLYRSFLNIFLNALQSLENGGTITVNVEEEDGYYLVTITDSGSGISKENLLKIFNPFFSTKDTGSGLGLSIVRKIIEGHKGKIWIEKNLEEPPDGESPGTRVMIKLPKE
ncbi:MAG: two-component sensor histidine kinase [Deltaproteobacteria bacterium]|nr:two-component sensor histidine kinase [Deltaproteobacteria bacterium]